MNIFSPFDGCACARVAVDKLGIPCTYYASEIDKWAIQIANKNYPDIIQLGDIRDIKGSNLPEIDLMIGGSPCQDLSVAGKGAGLKGSRSALFYDFVRLLEEIKPKYFVLENVASMKKIWRDKITDILGVEPILIDSALVSAQSRKRYYWTNIQGIEQPEDKGILLRDVIEDGVVDRDKSFCVDANYWKGTTPVRYAKYHARQVVFKSDNSIDRFNSVVQAIRENKPHQIGYIKKNYKGSRVYSFNGKSVSLTTQGGGLGAQTGLYFDNSEIRKLTPVECERLQTLPDNYTEGVSNTQRYRMLGNGFTVDVIVHILSYME